ncbi:MAG: DUF1553 domain-containing protein [Acidobacteria bacterium]|nr:DUF1553 domain-containing protein [Acidobacteriota bacterium]
MGRAAFAMWLAAGLAPAAAPDFARDIEPVFKARCHGCHAGRAHMGEFRLDSREAALRGGGSGVPAIVPGRSAESLLVRYIAGADKKMVMPPAGPRLTEAEVRAIREWIDGGAVWPATGASVAVETKPDPRNHWAFRPRVTVEPPRVKNTAWVRNPIDAFVLAKLEEKGMTPAPGAPPAHLLRRMTLDLNGLPPTPAEQTAFLADGSEEGYQKLIRDLLARPAYGERWARHWLDVVRYAETNGYERDAIKPSVWRYRDYVIEALNKDTPFDRFVLEQIAGDELPDATPATVVATGYNRLGPWDDEPADFLTDRFDQLDDIVSTTAQAFLGLTLGCARCHNHKFEPLLAKDYYAMVAVFNGLERTQRGRTELDVPIGAREEVARELERDRVVLRAEQELNEVRQLYRGLPVMPLLDRAAALQQRIMTVRQERPALPRGYFLRETKGSHAATHILIRGNALNPGPAVEPAAPLVISSGALDIPAPVGASSGRRLAFARWLASAGNPLTARVIVNRVWMHHFGEGLVRTPNDFGVMGERPVHPELLDWLANWFVDNGWSLKKLHALVLQSNAWRMSKQPRADMAALDPENRLLWRQNPRRLEVEAIRDSVLAASGRLSRAMYGPSFYPFVPAAALEGSSDPDKIWKPYDDEAATRRTIYAFIKRSMIVPLLEVLDFCDTSRSSAKRLNTSVATQALALFNGDLVNREAGHMAARLEREAGPDRAAQVDLAWRIALARAPSAEERGAMLRFLEGNSLKELCRVIFNLNEFVYTD